MILGKDAIILHVDDARRLVAAFLAGRSKDDLGKLQKQELLDLLNELRQMVKECDGEECEFAG